MNRPSGSRWVVLAALSAAGLTCSAFSGAAILIDDTVTRADQPAKPDQYKIWLQDGKLREEGVSGHIALVVDDTLYLLDSHQKNYEAFDRDALQRLSPDPDRIRQKLEADTARLSSAQRALAAKYLKPISAAISVDSPADALSDTGRTERWQGHDCEVWERKHEGRLVIQYLTFPAGDIAAGGEVQRVLPMLDRMTTGINLPAAMASQMSLLARARDLVTMAAVPVVTREFGSDGSLRKQSLLRLSVRPSLSDDKYVVPAGFQRVVSFERAAWLSP
jgi:hypothetical protein